MCHGSSQLGAWVLGLFSRGSGLQGKVCQQIRPKLHCFMGLSLRSLTMSFSLLSVGYRQVIKVNPNAKGGDVDLISPFECERTREHV